MTASDDADRSLLAALDVTRNARVGVGIGLLTAALAYVVRFGELLGPLRDVRAGPALFALLAIVLAISVAALVTAILTARSAIRLAAELE